MGAQMNIKSDEAYALASDLAATTGTSLTQIVLEALRAHARHLSKEQRLQDVLAIARDMRARMSPELLAANVDDLLYDEKGLPR